MKTIAEIAAEVGAAIEQAGACYFIGGSVASSAQGEPRATNDIDIVVDMTEKQVASFSEKLGSEYSIDEDSLREAIRTKGSWNIFYLPLVVKIDLFAKKAGPFDESEFARRQRVELLPGISVWLKSPEDSILRKLIWYRQGGSLSERQWRDVKEVIRVSGVGLDHGYLDRWAKQLNIQDLLARARTDAAH